MQVLSVHVPNSHVPMIFFLTYF